MWSYNVLFDQGSPLPEFGVEKVISVSDTGWEAFRFLMSSLSGTYLETRGHVIEGGPPLDRCALSDFIRPAVVCHVPRKQARQFIRRAELEAHCPPIRQGDALLIECGWGAQWRSPTYVTDGPGFHPECVPWLLEQPFSLLGVDVPCIAAPWPTSDPTAKVEGNMLLPIFEKGILLLAPLVNLDQVSVECGELIALPLKVEGVSGAPCRAIFRETNLVTLQA
jgi:kynurenine formamidase